MENKKPTNAQLTRRLNNAIVLVEKTKGTQSVFFSDRGLRLTVTEDNAVIETGYHKHVFSNVTSAGESRPYLYTKRLVELANDNDCKTETGYSLTRLMEVLKAKESQAEYNIATYTDWWLRNIFDSLYTIGETEAEAFVVYLDYVYGISKNIVILEQHNEDLTNKEFINKLITNLKSITENIEESVILKKHTDEEIVLENIKAVADEELEQEMENEKP